MKNVVYAVIIAACLIVAAGVYWWTHRSGPSGIDAIDASKVVWVKCKACGATYEIPERQYYKELEDKARARPTAMMFTPPLTCQKCSKDAVLKADKCDKCGTIFFSGTVPSDYQDRCPQCKYSRTEADRQEVLRQRQQQQQQ